MLVNDEQKSFITLAPGLKSENKYLALLLGCDMYSGAFFINISIRMKSLPGPNTLAYFPFFVSAMNKSVITLFVWQMYKTFTAIAK